MPKLWNFKFNCPMAFHTSWSFIRWPITRCSVDMGRPWMSLDSRSFRVLKWWIACLLWSTIFSVNAIEGHRLVHDCIPFILSYPEFFGWRPLDEDLFRVSLIFCSIGLKVVVGLKCPIHLHNQFGNYCEFRNFLKWNRKTLVAMVINSLIKKSARKSAQMY